MKGTHALATKAGLPTNAAAAVRRWQHQWFIVLCVCALWPSMSSAQVADTWATDRAAFVRQGRGQWQETHYGIVVNKFKEIARGPDSVVLFDASRGITVNLSDGKADVSSGTTALLTLNGRFFFTVWSYADRNGRFAHVDGKRWQEFQGGRPVFNFVQSARTTDSVELIDASRGIQVTLARGKATVSSMGAVVMGIAGDWSR
jgi:hypothetical protein